MDLETYFDLRQEKEQGLKMLHSEDFHNLLSI